jgi:hypothetical protein
MRHWVGVLDEEQFATERLYARDSVALAVGSGEDAEPGDRVALVAAGAPPVLVGHGTVVGRGESVVHVEYQVRLFDEPPAVPADVRPDPVTAGLHPLATAQFIRVAALVTASAEAGAGRSVWFVSLALPIEAGTPAEAVREFWSYVDKLGPRELPAYVWPLGDELAMQAFVLGAVTNLDPEPDDD